MRELISRNLQFDDMTKSEDWLLGQLKLLGEFGFLFRTQFRILFEICQLYVVLAGLGNTERLHEREDWIRLHFGLPSVAGQGAKKRLAYQRL